MELCITGIAASGGVGMGRVRLLVKPGTEELPIRLAEGGGPEEWARTEAAFLRADAKMADIREETRVKVGEEEARIFDAYRMFLADPMMRDGIRDRILEGGLTAVEAIRQTVAELQQLFLSMDNEYMRERAEDVHHVGSLVADILSGRETPDLSRLTEDVILVAEDLSPAQTATMDRARVKGLVTLRGGAASHTAIMARTLEIPAVVGCGSLPVTIADGDIAILDGNAGEMWVHPNPWRVAESEKQIRRMFEASREMERLRDVPCVTVDGRRIELFGNIAAPIEAGWVVEKGGDGIGLFRTEFLFMDRDTLPTEDEQTAAYTEALSTLAGRPLVVRTMDIGGDKPLKNLDLPQEDNPFLGYRAIRICLDRPELFRTQLRAILRAGTGGDIRIMFPMISSLSELRAAKRMLSDAEESLRLDGIPFRSGIPAGVMIEIPAACLIADLLAKEAAFFSIGTNDLTQYALAVDRMNGKVGALYNPLHPGVLRLIRMTCDAAARAGIPAAMCGEMAGDPRFASLLAGLGLNEFSMSPASLPKVKKVLLETSMQDAVLLANRALEQETAEDVARLLKEWSAHAD